MTIYDPGMQPERTALAWQRTSLAIAVGFLASGRTLLPTIGWWSAAVTGAGIAACALFYMSAARRYRRIHTHLTTVDAAALPTDARLVLLCASIVFALGVFALGWVLLR